jgi:ADP-ribose pyrophosphatase
MNRTTLYEGKYKRLVRQGNWEFTERVNCSGVVVVLALTKDKKVLLIEQRRIPVGKNVIEFPAGLVNDDSNSKNETLEDAARRELLEETGYEAKTIRFCIQGPASQASSADILTIFTARGLRKISPALGDGTESITVHEVPLRQADRWLKNKEKQGCLVDPKIYAGLYLLKKKL